MSGKIRIRIRLFGALRDAMGEGELEREIARGASVDELWRELSAGCPALAARAAARLCAVNLDFADGATTLNEGDEVAFFPPVSGG